MSEFDRGKLYPKKKFQQRDSSNSLGRSFFNSKGNNSTGGYSRYDKEHTSSENAPKILLKARINPEEIVSSPKRVTQKETENLPGTITIVPSIAKENEATSASSFKQMHRCAKLLEDGVLFTESLQEFVQENNDFLVVGVVGAHGVGKSTILNLLAHKRVTKDIKKSVFKSFHKTSSDDSTENIQLLTQDMESVQIKDSKNEDPEIFKVETTEDIEYNMNATQGIDIFITSNRVILLDCQPCVSVCVLDDLIQCENKRTNLVSEFIPLENSGEIQGLQLTAFLMSVCHVLVLVQDWFFDSNIIRFIQSAEMLKPTISNPEDELNDHFPHLLLVHNKAQMEDFSPKKFKTMQQVYKSLFHKTKLQLETNLGLGSGYILNSLNVENCGSPLNLYLVPEYDPQYELNYNGHPTLQYFIKRLRANILGATKNSLTHVQLTEKTWLVYCSKVWDTVKKSSFFVEYTKLMP